MEACTEERPHPFLCRGALAITWLGYARTSDSLRPVLVHLVFDRHGVLVRARCQHGVALARVDCVAGDCDGEPIDADFALGFCQEMLRRARIVYELREPGGKDC